MTQQIEQTSPPARRLVRMVLGGGRYSATDIDLGEPVGSGFCYRGKAGHSHSDVYE